MSWKTIVKENNLAVSVVRSNHLVDRIDAEYFDPAYLEQDSVLKKKDPSTMAEYVDVSDGNHLSITQYFVNKGGVPYFRGQDVNNIFLKSANPMRISREVFDMGWMKRSHFEPNDILLSIVGTIGGLSFVPNDFGLASGSCKIAILRPKHEKLAKILMTFLLGKYGQYQLKRMTRGAVQMGIILADVPGILVPHFSKPLTSAIDDQIGKVFEMEKASREHYSEAERLLLKEIHLENFTATNENISVINFTEAIADNRFDAEYWLPKYEEIEKRVADIKQERLGDIVSAKKGVEVGADAYLDEGKDFVRVSDFSVYGIDDVTKKISDELYDSLKEKYSPKKDEVLFTKDGTIGLSFALDENLDAVVSGAFLRLKPTSKINRTYLALVLNSLYCKEQIERMSGGAIIAHLKPADAMQIKIPILSDEKQNQLAEKVLEAFRLRREAKSLLEKAKRAVEIFVEKDEKEALSFLKY